MFKIQTDRVTGVTGENGEPILWKKTERAGLVQPNNMKAGKR